MMMSNSGIMVFLALLQFNMTDEYDSNVSIFHEDRNYINLLKVASFGVTIVLAIAEKNRGSIHSYPLFFFWGMMTFADGLVLYKEVMDGSFMVDFSKLSSVVPLLNFIGSTFQTTLSSLPVFEKDSNETHPHELSSLPGKALISWVGNIVLEGYKKGLKEEDIPDIPNQDKGASVFSEFQKAWALEEQSMKKSTSDTVVEDDKNENPFQKAYAESLKKSQKNPEESKQTVHLMKVLFRQYGKEYVANQLAKFLFEFSDIVPPIITSYFLTYMKNRDTEPAWKGYMCVVALGLHRLFVCWGGSKAWTVTDRLAYRMKATLELAVYKKVLTAKNQDRKYITSGEVINLAAEDANKLVHGIKWMYLMINAPFTIIIAFAILYSQVGVGAFIGMGLIIILIPVNKWIGNKLKRIQEQRTKVKEKRIKIMNEVLNGIKVLKLYAWEKSFLKRVTDVRDEEIDVLKKSALIHGGLELMFRACPFFVRMVGYVAFINSGGYLDAAVAFSTADLFNNLSWSLNVIFMVLPDLVMANEAVHKLNKFFNLEDIPDEIVSRDTPNEKEPAINIAKGDFTWDSTNGEPSLKNINITVPKGGLVAVVGLVGCGKSSLLSAINGEMEKLGGTVKVQGSVAYIPQEAWILNTSLKNNIIFGSNIDNTLWYDNVLDACSLRRDLSLLANGDKTLIGEKGVNLSGGQKQRVSLARAVYADTDVYLLDDPLSAVDAHVGKHIFEHVIGKHGVLRDKTRVMVTHGVHWLPYVDKVIVVKDGKVSETGSYKQLLDHDGAFAQFVREVTKNDKVAHDDVSLNQMKQKIFRRLVSLEEGTPVIETDESDSEEEDDSKPKKGKMTFRSISTMDSIPEDGELSPDEKTSKPEKLKKKTESEDSKSKPDADDECDEDEDEEKTGNVGMSVYMEYIWSVGMKSIIIILALFTTLISCREVKEWELVYWSDDPLLSNLTLSDTEEYQDRNWGYLWTYFLFGLGEVTAAFLYLCTVLYCGCEAAKHHHNKLLVNILRSPMSFFDTTATGKIITRFSKDIGSVDGLNHALGHLIRIVVNVVLGFIMVLIVIPKMVKFIIPAVIIYYLGQRVFAPNLVQIRRYGSKARPPVEGHLSECLNGVDSIRAYGMQNRFMKIMNEKVERVIKISTSESWMYHWFNIRSQILMFVIKVLAALIIMWDDTMTAGEAGIALNFANHFFDCFSGMMHHWTHIEKEMVSLERVIEYSSKPTEASWETGDDVEISSKWPENGDIVIKDYQTRYREGLDLVLKGVSCNIKSGEKVGIVGRTGAGKSSLTMALFRLIESVSGTISLNGQNIAPIGLHDVRKKLTILPQDPIIFGGTLKMNLDPFEEKTDEQIWDALKHAHLKTYVESLPQKLDHDCGEGGKNLSIGQRQLVCLARALLRHSHVLVLDEATAGVDMETDDLIQNTIRNEFKDCTVLTIAHRLNTILDYDRIMVLDAGTVAEFDSPQALLKDSSSIFHGMAKDANLV